MSRSPLKPVALVIALGLTLGVAVALQWSAIRNQSLIGDTSYHLVAGHQALRYGQNTLNLEHPPLVKLIAALPLLLEEPIAPPLDVRGVLDVSRHLYEDPELIRRIQTRSRSLLLVCFGFPLVLSCFGLGSHLAGRRVGIILAVFLALSFSSLPFLSVIQTDTAVALGFVLTLWMSLRFLEKPSWQRSIILGAAFGLALATKFTGLLLGPTVLLAVALAPQPSLSQRLKSLIVTSTVAIAVLGSTYAVANRNYDPKPGRQAIELYCQGEALVTDDTLVKFQEPLLQLESVSPFLAAYATGVLGVWAQNDLGIYPSYALGELTSQGRWWYFPLLLLIRTPWVLLASTFLAAIGLLSVLKKRSTATPLQPVPQGRSKSGAWILGTTITIYMGFAISSSYNLGIRHLLPVLPMLYLPAAIWTAKTRQRTLAVVSVLALESILIGPLWMSATGSWWLGGRDPMRLMIVSGDTEYHQNLLVLEQWAENNEIDEFQLAFPLLDQRELAAYSSRGRLFDPHDPVLPGWYVTSILLESYLPAVAHASNETVRGFPYLSELAGQWASPWSEIQKGQDLGPIAGTFRAYRVLE